MKAYEIVNGTEVVTWHIPKRAPDRGEPNRKVEDFNCRNLGKTFQPGGIGIVMRRAWVWAWCALEEQRKQLAWASRAEGIWTNNNSSHLLSTCYVPCHVLNTLYLWIYLMIPKSLWSSCYYYSHFSEDELRHGKLKWLTPWSHSW